MAEKIEAAKREKFYTVSARLVFSGILVVIIAALILGTSAIINKGPIVPILGIGNKNAGGFNPTNASTSILPTSFATTTVQPILINVTCSPFISFNCRNPYCCHKPKFRIQLDKRDCKICHCRYDLLSRSA
jgi:hypothetical protein